MMLVIQEILSNLNLIWIQYKCEMNLSPLHNNSFLDCASNQENVIILNWINNPN